MPRFKVKSPELYIRPQPNPDNAPLGKLKQGAIVEKLGESDKWYFVKIDIDSNVFNGEITGWASSECLDFATPPTPPGPRPGPVVGPPAGPTYPTEPFSIDSDLKQRPSPVTAALIDDYLKEHNSPLEGIGAAVMAAAQKYDINPIYIVSHAIHETGWGKSHICQEKHNLFGWGAYDPDPMGGAATFAKWEICIDTVMRRINELYLTENGRFFVEKPCLGNKSYGMNVNYATDPEWGSKIAHISAIMEDWVMAKMAQPPGPQPVTLPPGAQRILAVVDRVNPTQPYYLRHDIGEGFPETFCNWFVADALEVMGIQLPRYDDSAGHYPTPHPLYGNELKCKPYTAGALYNYFEKGGDDKWSKWEKVERPKSVTLANQGEVVVVCMPAPPGGQHGHIALVIPGGSDSEVRIAQAGRCCGKNMKLEEGFGGSEVGFFSNVG